MAFHLKFLFISSIIISVSAWDNDDLEVFDVVEEVNQNFYELLGVQQDATPSEIKSAFRSLTLKLHPDKNDAPDADVQFRNLVSVHNVLKDPGKREKYNEVLKNGLPNWRSAIYYYRHVRKMGLAEMSIILFIIITIGQYVVGWAAYAEKRYTAEVIINSRMKKSRKKDTASTELTQILDLLKPPTIKDTLPFQIPKAIWTSIVSIPYAISSIHQLIKDRQEEKANHKKWEEDEKLRCEREAAEIEAAKAARAAAGPRKRRGFLPLERESLLDSVNEIDSQDEKKVEEKKPPPIISGGLWTDDDLTELVRLVKKYPGGTPERWERIAETMYRSVNEVTHMAAKLKENSYRLPGQDDVESLPAELPKKQKTKGGKLSEGASAEQSIWSQLQQRSLETALARFPKGGAGDRWEKIANCVPDKTKEECMLRCKYLSDMVKKQRQKEEEALKQAEDNQDTAASIQDHTDT